jgi:hypothetical protein
MKKKHFNRSLFSQFQSFIFPVSQFSDFLRSTRADSGKNRKYCY